MKKKTSQTNGVFCAKLRYLITFPISYASILEEAKTLLTDPRTSKTSFESERKSCTDVIAEKSAKKLQINHFNLQFVMVLQIQF